MRRYTVVARLLKFCFTVVTVLLQWCDTGVTLSLYCCHTVVNTLTSCKLIGYTFVYYFPNQTLSLVKYNYTHTM
jgi:hypothetical protein